MPSAIDKRAQRHQKPGSDHSFLELNPVRAAMVEHPGAYFWSSYAHNAYGRPDRMISSHPLYTALGLGSQQRQEAYRELFRHQLDASLIHDIRDAVNQELVLGRDRFKERIEEMTKRQTRPKKSGRPRTLGVAERGADYYVV